MELPVTFRRRMLELLGEQEFQQYEDSFCAERMYGLRVNTRKISVEEFQKISPFKLEPVPWIENGFYYDGTTDSPAKHPFYHAGLYYLQEPSAMTPANLLPVEPGERVLDLCAAPGGKATELGVKLQDKGLLAANDISNSRAKGLLKNLELFGMPNMMVLNETPQKLLDKFGQFFDKILIDAPCSGEGMFRKDPAIMKSWMKKGPKEFAAIQREIVTTTVQMLRPGGSMLYSTCTFSPEENEGTILHLLKECEDMEVLEVSGHYDGFAPGRPEWLGTQAQGYEEQLRRCIRIWPHKMNGEGHFIALLHKKGEGVAEAVCRRTGKVVDNEDFREFLKLLNVKFDESRFEMYQERVYYMPDGAAQAKGLHLLRNGLLMGECKKNRFEPSQALAMALRMEQCVNAISLSQEDVRVIKYLKGETIEVDDVTKEQAAGWHLFCVEGYPLGWGKLTRGTLKNKYHAGWRWM